MTLRRFGALFLAFVVLVFGIAVGRVIRSPVGPPPSPHVVNDVTQLNPIIVNDEIAPTTTEEISEAVRRHAGPLGPPLQLGG